LTPEDAKEPGVVAKAAPQRSEARVTEPFYIARTRVEKIEGVHRRAHLEAGTQFDMGVHGEIKRHYGIDSPDLPLPVDYIVAATGG
jgi:hypothetical protein